MQPTQDATVYIVDDDAGVREALGWLLRSRRQRARCRTAEHRDELAPLIRSPRRRGQAA